MSKFIVAAHTVEAEQITGISSLRGLGGQMMGPDAGVLLITADNAKHRWLIDKDGILPEVGDYLVFDANLHVTYVVKAASFSEGFVQADDNVETKVL